MILVVAYNKNLAIAQDGVIPWNVPEDMQHFKMLTTGGSVIMGRKTYDTLPKQFRPLPDRFNIVITRSFDEQEQGVYYTNSLHLAKHAANTRNEGSPVFVIGGEQIYNLALSEGLVTKVVASEIKDDTVGDKFFPNLESMGWKCEIVKEYDQFIVKEFTPPECK